MLKESKRVKSFITSLSKESLNDVIKDCILHSENEACTLQLLYAVDRIEKEQNLDSVEDAG